MSGSARRLARKAAKAAKAAKAKTSPAELEIGKGSKGSLAWRGIERVLAQHALPKELREDEVPRHPCGHCGVPSNGATNGDGKKPKPGDYAVCWACANVNRFDAELRLVRVTEEEFEAIDDREVDVRVLEESRALLREALLIPLRPNRTRGDA